jgi:hypothetical protein
MQRASNSSLSFFYTYLSCTSPLSHLPWAELCLYVYAFMLNIYFLLAKRSFSDMHWDSGGRKWISYLLLEAAKSKPKQSRSVFYYFSFSPSSWR